MKLFSILLVTAALGVAAAPAQSPTSTTTTTNNTLPAGLIREGGVVMMQPIADFEEGSAAGPIFGGEHRTALFRVLSPSDHELLSRSVEFAERGDWTDARAQAAQASDVVGRLVIEWGYLLDKNSGASFGQIADFLKNYPDWPLRDTLFARAEKAMPPEMEPPRVVAWFADRTPRSGIGKVRLGDALIATGVPSRGQALIRDAWINNEIEADQEAYVLARHPDLLTPDVERERVERLLFRDHLGAARRELARLDPETRHLMEARLDLRERASLGERQIAELSPAQRNDPGLLFDEIQLDRERNEVTNIPALLERIPAAQFASLSPSRWWLEIGQDARTALRLGFASDAYRIAATAALPRDASEYPDAEFLAGWIALRKLGDARLALPHFQNLIAVATHPVTRSRAHYWTARALEAASETAEATGEYRAAANDPATFYGQLALARLEPSAILHLESTVIGAEVGRATYEQDALLRPMRVLADLGLETPLREFAAKDCDLHPDAAHLKLLAEDLTRMGYREIAVRAMKAASYIGIRYFEYSHPVIAVPRFAGSGIAPEDALVLAIIRQETEFDPAAVSAAGALGLMQVMPDAARQTAEKMGMSYQPADLRSDVAYNMELGTAQLAHDLSVWNGSYLMAAAAYNAGLGNVHKWVVAFGDPRDPRIDPLDWIEEIPFSETRNYVERVLENVEVYRNRLSGRDEPLRIWADLRRGEVLLPAPGAYAPTESSVTIEPALPQQRGP